MDRRASASASLLKTSMKVDPFHLGLSFFIPPPPCRQLSPEWHPTTLPKTVSRTCRSTTRPRLHPPQSVAPLLIASGHLADPRRLQISPMHMLRTPPLAFPDRSGAYKGNAVSSALELSSPSRRWADTESCHPSLSVVLASMRRRSRTTSLCSRVRLLSCPRALVAADQVRGKLTR